jgi:hypothetical protein
MLSILTQVKDKERLISAQVFWKGFNRDRVWKVDTEARSEQHIPGRIVCRNRKLKLSLERGK